MNPAPNLVMIGPMGAGKSSIGRRIAKHFNLHFADTDHAIVERAGTSISTIFKYSGEPEFRRLEREVLHDLLNHENRLIATGGGTILDPENRHRMQKRGFVVFLKINVNTQLERLAHDRYRPLLQQTDRKQVLSDLYATRQPLYQKIADMIVTTDHMSPNTATAQLILDLTAHWQKSSNTA
ncbi:shikimate kinase [Xylella fastidiosa]|uniref:Shikimate kinase n=2 Tax=Xylella fastidiosa TaxID=2371 RepID=AROK_XYLFM|nr:shikimate kinase [Xylella fastidiosa]B0U6C8.1 RecName: Full=Shikimate kinase; Short=SK [Xylella fastidiosa M12]ERI59845.1 shikimate kinase [Xylella fastidiosa subsp. multiplex Griffin-1]ACA11690.1 Shikimate kinase [Xylella fastidiosa M12]KFA41204.1 shikimate kinase [Xylella fastidiosa]MBE0269138.1 shikimate kinase [Xylella fastidiosa subsp. multiplex]MBE0275796.1 shikimate kinase [Xylella fastidiosa subsp. multiplex]